MGKLNKFRVCWHAQVGCGLEPYYVEVMTIDEGVKIMDALAHYDLYQFENKIKPDYSNASHFEMWQEGEWVDFWDEETGEDNPRELVLEKTTRHCPDCNGGGGIGETGVPCSLCKGQGRLPLKAQPLQCSVCKGVGVLYPEDS